MSNSIAWRVIYDMPAGRVLEKFFAHQEQAEHFAAQKRDEGCKRVTVIQNLLPPHPSAVAYP